ncbi:response regulator [Geobacter sp. SVR]|uniref:response regulator n=1 Tax=Geobacter sp. SVR TaxID=2495594 RepID=UPI00143F03DB|nr:response regulator [Geobacter sp. SVR]BCS52391.1 response regulator [Geobacter sp. SVR]GCF87376.1 response regulator [Geobacter sp. SVR]
MALILLVDDSSFARNLTGKILKKAGHELMEAEDGIAGLKALTTRTPDCIIADMLMPGMDGQKLLLALRNANNRIPVIILTADVQEKTRNDCLELGARDVLHKPPRPETLLATVENVLAKGA